jgi:hypothetical protein
MPAYLFTVLWATEVFRITEREVQAQVTMYPDEGGEVIRPAWNREHADDLRPARAMQWWPPDIARGPRARGAPYVLDSSKR